MKKPIMSQLRCWFIPKRETHSFTQKMQVVIESFLVGLATRPVTFWKQVTHLRHAERQAHHHHHRRRHHHHHQ